MAEKPWADQPFELVPTSKTSKWTVGPEITHIADTMANIHNCLLRGLNSIYLQAPYVTAASDINDLLQYTLFWGDTIHHHHDAEESAFFPGIERLTNQKGLMDVNVEQHDTFTSGLEALMGYAKACRDDASPQSYDAAKFREIIDSFGANLARHLKDEIPSLFVLDKFDVKNIMKEFELFDAKVREGADKLILFPLVMGCADFSYEGGNNWPPLPMFIPPLVHYWFERKYQSVWRFNPSTTYGRRRPLHFLP